MKKILLVLACVACTAMVGAQEKVVFGKMPKQAQEFVQTNFAKFNVQDVEMNRSDKDEKYTVTFMGNDQIVFDNRGNWTEINMQSGTIPATVIPAGIKGYVGDNYKNYRITKLMHDDNGYKAQLSNGQYLYFDSEGNPAKTVR